MESFSIDWNQIGENLLRIIIAFALALPIGWERGRGTNSVGLRTFPIVAMASCGYVLISKFTPGATADTQARFIQGLIAGIGFIGGGAIVKEGTNVSGIVTAASIWNTGAIGIAIAAEREEVAIVLSVMNFLTLLLLTPIVKRNAEECAEEESKNDAKESSPNGKSDGQEK